MKKLKTAVLSLLLLSFCFIGFHDHFFAENHLQEPSCAEISLDSEQKLINIVHESLHHLFVYFEIKNFSFDPLQSQNPSFVQSNLSSYTTAVLLRPPLC